MKQYPDPTNLKTRFFPETGKNGSVDMHNHKPKRSRGIHPHRCGLPPNAINPEQVILHYR